MNLLVNPLIQKLSRFLELSDEECREIDAWSLNPGFRSKGQRLIKEGARTDVTCLVLRGWACRRKGLKNGKDQIIGLLLPGDMCDLHSFLVASADHSLCTLTNSAVVVIQPETLLESLKRQPRLSQALWWATLVDIGIARE